MKVVVTRPAAQAEPLVERLARLGHEVEVCPLIAVEPLGDDPIDASGYEWVIVTSANGAEELARRLVGTLPNVAAIGRGTADALARHGIQSDLVPRVSTQEGLLAELPRATGRALFAAAEGARRLLVEELEADFVPLYRTTELRPASFPPADLVLLASPSAARAYAALGLSMPAISIGPQTTEAAERAGVHVIAEADTHDADGLVRAVARATGSTIV